MVAYLLEDDDEEITLTQPGSLDDLLADGEGVDPDWEPAFGALIPEGWEPGIGSWASGTRVAFQLTLSSLLAYPNPPNPKVLGTVVKCRTATGDTTVSDGMVFVKWDSGGFMPIHAAHLKQVAGVRTATANTRRVSSMGDLSDFMRTAGGEGDLVHKSTKDLWKLSKSKEGYVIERLFDTDGEPLKV